MKNEAIAGQPLPSAHAPAIDSAPEGEGTIREPRPATLGWLPALSASTALGLLIVALGFTFSRNGVSWAESLFWLGLIVIYAPIVTRLLSGDCPRGERIALVAVLGVGLYLVEVFHSPVTFTEHDEFLDWRTAIDILQSGHLFHVNPLLPVSALFPGMEMVTSALASVAHLSIFQAGVLVIGCARLVLMLSVFFFIEEASGSSRVAGIAAAIYMANPNFLFFDAAYKYETMALTFAGLALFLLARWQRSSGAGGDRLMALAAVMVAATAITHHLTAYLLTVFLIVWAAVAFFRRRTEPGWAGVAGLALLAVATNSWWLALVARATIDYLSPVLSSAIESVWNVILLHQSVRAPFTSTTGYVFPIWERAAGVASVAIIVAGLALGIWQLWQRRRSVRAVGVALAACALAYPVTLAFRFSGAAWETANRSSEFVFLACGFVMAVAIVAIWPRAWPRWRVAATLPLCLTVVFVGGVIAGWTPQWRMPGPYLPLVADTRGIDNQTLAASSWARAYLGRHQRFGADDLNDLPLGSLGDQNVISGLFGGENMNFVLMSPTFVDLNITRRTTHIAYLLVDFRAIHAQYSAEYGLVPFRAGLTPAQTRARAAAQISKDLSKFDRDRSLDRLYDSGQIAIYGVKGHSGGS